MRRPFCISGEGRGIEGEGWVSLGIGPQVQGRSAAARGMAKRLFSRKVLLAPEHAGMPERGQAEVLRDGAKSSA